MATEWEKLSRRAMGVLLVGDDEVLVTLRCHMKLPNARWRFY